MKSCFGIKRFNVRMNRTRSQIELLCDAILSLSRSIQGKHVNLSISQSKDVANLFRVMAKCCLSILGIRGQSTFKRQNPLECPENIRRLTRSSSLTSIGRRHHSKGTPLPFVASRKRGQRSPLPSSKRNNPREQNDHHEAKGEEQHGPRCAVRGGCQTRKQNEKRPDKRIGKQHDNEYDNGVKVAVTSPLRDKGNGNEPLERAKNCTKCRRNDSTKDQKPRQGNIQTQRARSKHANERESQHEQRRLRSPKARHSKQQKRRNPYERTHQSPALIQRSGLPVWKHHQKADDRGEKDKTKHIDRSGPRVAKPHALIGPRG